MNAVKRCLALLAATVAIGACSGDPTADLAGADLKIRATPGTVWMYHSKPTTARGKKRSIPARAFRWCSICGTTCIGFIFLCWRWPNGNVL